MFASAAGTRCFAEAETGAEVRLRAGGGFAGIHRGNNYELSLKQHAQTNAELHEHVAQYPPVEQQEQQQHGQRGSSRSCSGGTLIGGSGCSGNRSVANAAFLK